MLLKGRCVGPGCSLLKSQYTGKTGGKESLLYFICWQLAWAVADICSKANVHPPWQAGGESFIDKVGEGLHAEIVQSSSNWSWVVWLVSSWLLSIQFSRSVVSNSMLPSGLQHTGLPCPSPTPGTCSNSCPLSRWCHPKHPLSCFRYSWSLVPGCTCSHVFVVSSQNCGCSSPGYSVVIM